MSIVNLQRLPITLYREDGSLLRLMPQPNTPYVEERIEKATKHDMVPVYDPLFSEVHNMPNLEDANIYLTTVSIANTLKLPNLVVPIHAVRDSTGHIIGFRGLKRWL